jgi:hypothetical protein
MPRRRLDTRTLLLMSGATLGGVIWAIYNRGLVSPPYDESELRPLVWVIFATPFALWLGWLIARWREAWWATFVCLCLYFFSPFVAQRYESCTIVSGSFSLSDCFTATAEAQRLANDSGHVIYFASVIVIHAIAALAIAMHRALRPRSASDELPAHDAGPPEAAIEPHAP